jgi:hypothetical protein
VWHLDASEDVEVAIRPPAEGAAHGLEVTTVDAEVPCDPALLTRVWADVGDVHLGGWDGGCKPLDTPLQLTC